MPIRLHVHIHALRVPSADTRKTIELAFRLEGNKNQKKKKTAMLLPSKEKKAHWMSFMPQEPQRAFCGVQMRDIAARKPGVPQNPMISEIPDENKEADGEES